MKLLVVSNRLPFSIKEEGGHFTLEPSPGGLVSGLSAYLDSLRGSTVRRKPYVWVGWPGAYLKKEFREDLRTKALMEYNAYPVFVQEKLMERFYLGFCNKTIWPLFHYFPTYVVYDEEFWDSYRKVNELFCDAIMEVVRPGDVIWVHDYHLMLLPKMIRSRLGDRNPIGFFLHIPFPAYDIYSILPNKWREEILAGLVGADLIGFHTFDYSQHFLKSVLRILGLENSMGILNVDGRVVKVDTFPMGIDFNKYYKARSRAQVKREIINLSESFEKFKVILSIDRLDYTKGVANRLKAYEIFLDKFPEWTRKIVLVMVIVPSRIGVEHYQIMKRQIDELVGKINGKFGTIDWQPIIYQYKHLNYEQLSALYYVSDIALVTPLRDGMNLVAKEYVAAKGDNEGVLILSEMAGAARELQEAIIVNPNNAQEIVDAISQALVMDKMEMRERMTKMQQRIRRYNVTRWAVDFVETLIEIKKASKAYESKSLTERTRNRIYSAYHKAKDRILFLDYDGTLVPFFKNPKLAKPDEDLLELLRSLVNQKGTEVVIVSGRDKGTLDYWFSKIPVSLIAEHGVWIKKPNEEWTLIKPLDNTWKGKIRSIMEIYSDRLPGAFVEEKEYSVSWHYRASEPERAAHFANELFTHLVDYTSNVDLQVLQGNKVIEVRCSGVDKGSACLHFLSQKDYHFIMAIGDDWTDEDMYKALPLEQWTIKVGSGSTFAKYVLKNYLEVRALLRGLLNS